MYCGVEGKISVMCNVLEMISYLWTFVSVLMLFVYIIYLGQVVWESSESRGIKARAMDDICGGEGAKLQHVRDGTVEYIFEKCIQTQPYLYLITDYFKFQRRNMFFNGHFPPK